MAQAAQQAGAAAMAAMTGGAAPHGGTGAWKKVDDPGTGQAYYHNAATGETSWDLPLPGGWEKVNNPGGEPYYYNASTGETSWSPPAEAPSPPVFPPSFLP